MNTISTNAFSKNHNNSELAVEASTLGWPCLHAPEMFTLTSEWTHRSIAMKKVGTETSDEGDILLWKYKPANRAADVKLTVEVFND